MASVTAFTAARSLAIENAAITSGLVDVNGNLILTSKGGGTVNAGSVIGPVGPGGPPAPMPPPFLNGGQVITDWNLANDIGFWWGDTAAANSPLPGVEFHGVVIEGNMAATKQQVLLTTAAAAPGTQYFYTRVSSDSGSTWTSWTRITSKHILESATNLGRTFFGTGDTATSTENGGASYLGLSPVNDSTSGNMAWLTYNGTQLFGFTKDGHISFPTNNALPYAVAAGRAVLSVTSAGGTTSVSVTFPVGKFAVIPRLNFAIGGSSRLSIAYNNLTVNGFTVSCSNFTSTDAGASTIDWTATQMLVGSADG